MIDWWLAYNIAIGLGLLIVGGWAFDTRRTMARILRLARLNSYDLPTEEIELPPTMRVGPRLEEFGPGKPVPHGTQDPDWRPGLPIRR